MNTGIPNKFSWQAGYKAFLLDKNESLVLKVAPIVLLLGSPEVLASNLLPGIGEVVDFGALTLTLVVIFKTWRAVRRHRKHTDIS